MSRSKKLERLTSEQQAQLPLIRDKWLAVGLSTEPAERDRAEVAVRLAYQRAGLAEPALIVWLDSPMAGAVGASVLAEVRDQVRDQVVDQVVNQVRDQVVDQVVDQVRDQVRDQIGAQVWDQVGDQVGSQAKDQIGIEFGAQVRDQLGRCGYGQFDANWIGWIAAFREFNLRDEVIDKIDGLTALTESCGLWWPLAGLCILTERPTRLRRDDQHRLHSADGAALQYPDGWGIYAWHGVRVEKAVILRPESLTIAQIRDEANVEVRRVMLERFGFDRYLTESGALPIHADETGTLYRCALSGDEPLVCVRVINRTPEPTGESKHHILRVPPDMTQARQAVAWSFSQTADQYRPTIET